MVIPTEPYRLRGLACALNSSYMSESQERISTENQFARLKAISEMRDAHTAMADATLRSVDIKERAISAAGAAILSSIFVNPLDVAKTRLQAQAAGLAYQEGAACLLETKNPNKIPVDGWCRPPCPRTSTSRVTPACPPPGPPYKGTWDVIQRVVRKEGFFRLWRGLNASLAISVPTVGIYMPSYDILRESLERYSDENSLQIKPFAPLLAGSVARSLACIVCSPLELARTRMQAEGNGRGGALPGILAVLQDANIRSGQPGSFLQGIRVLWTGVGAQLARDVPFSAICWATLEPIRSNLLEAAGPDPHLSSVLGANFTAGVLAGSLAAAATSPLDVVKTWRQIEKDPTKALSKSIPRTLYEVWSKGGVRGLFVGVGPRMGRSGPSTGIVVSLYEVVKHLLHTT